ncbi:ABC transporter permease [Actinotalea ferrariae]|uniref:ABC transporter permease n=1 Tax=Actinotalea ferrariae TaxID=1386098 RepID=UPI001C8BF0D4|nr:ABC transporter permease [Actinotalea ferrariae]MBX9244509.1 ABC transporter permease [Actinotalea ferrariae]
MSTTDTLVAPSAKPSTPEGPAGPGVLQRVLDASWLTIVLAILLALVASSVLIAAANAEVQAAAGYFFSRPADMLGAAWDAIYSAYSALFRGAVFDYEAEGVRRVRPITETMTASVPLILAGLGLAVAFRSGLFNIGAQGQVLMGAAGATFVGITYDLPIVVHVLLSCLAAISVGALWAGIAGFLKARTGANEVIVTIMLNNIAFYLVSFLLTTTLLRQGGTRPISPEVAGTSLMPRMLGLQFRLHWGFVVAILAAVLVWWLMERSVLGFQFRAVGANQRAARTAGIRVNLVFVLVMLVAGGLAGLGGAMQILGTDRTLQASSAGSIGFDAITVALLGRSKPVGTVLAALLFGALRAGSPLMQTSADTPIDIILVIQASIVLLIAAPVLVRELSPLHRAAQLFGYRMKEARA